MYRKQARRRRIILVTLIVVALGLLSLHFSEAESGPLHTVQEGVATVLSPFEEVASRALKPVRDLADWFDETFKARGENEDLKAELATAREQLAAAEKALSENEELRGLLKLGSGEVVSQYGYEPVTSRVIGRSPSIWYSTVTIDRGSSTGLRADDPVVSADGLVGRIGKLTPNTAQVELITDRRNAVSAKVLANGPQGVLVAEIGKPDDLVLDFPDSDREAEAGQKVITAGWQDGDLSSAYPYGIAIGEVVESVTDGEQDVLRVHVSPYADIRDLDFVVVLTGGDARPGVPG